MTLLHPRTERDPVEAREAEALIREARHLRRRRWTVGLLIAAVVGAGTGWAVAARSPHGSRPARRVVHRESIRGGLPEGAYANLKVAPARIAPGGSATVSVEVTNSGLVAADEIVELYLHALVSMPVRPVEELRGFRRITLRPGERRTVSFTVGPDQLEAWDIAMHRTVQPGDFDVLVGRSSADFLKGRLTVQ